jgi:hypothetical protein
MFLHVLLYVLYTYMYVQVVCLLLCVYNYVSVCVNAPMCPYVGLTHPL